MGVIFNSSSESPWASVPTVARTNLMETKSICGGVCVYMCVYAGVCVCVCVCVWFFCHESYSREEVEH